MSWLNPTLGHTSLDITSKYLHISPDRSSGEVLVKRWSEPFLIFSFELVAHSGDSRDDAE